MQLQMKKKKKKIKIAILSRIFFLTSLPAAVHPMAMASCSAHVRLHALHAQCWIDIELMITCNCQ